MINLRVDLGVLPQQDPQPHHHSKHSRNGPSQQQHRVYLIEFCVILCTREIVLIREEKFIAKDWPVKLQFDGLLGTNIK